jgi:FkbM family methyltransferase
MRTSGLRLILVAGSAALLRPWYRYVPSPIGKRRIWNSVVTRLLARGDGVRLSARTRFGARMNVRLPDSIQTFVYFFGVWEPSITAYLNQTLRPGDTVIDIGANVGYDTLLASHLVGPTGEVHAIEASPFIHGLLSENLALNRTVNVKSYNSAVFATDCLVPVFLHRDSNLGGSTIMPAVAGRRVVAMEATVPGRPLASIIPEATILRAKLIKIDVEGAEWPVIQGFAGLLPHLSRRTELLIEISAEALRDQGSSVAAFLALFRRAGFSAWSIENQYTIDTYLGPVRRPEPLIGEDFGQLDVLFRRD